jgi:carboxymethylenebutenolidase
VLIAKNDAERMPKEKAELDAALAAAHRRGKVEVYPANHGWSVAGSQTYDEKQAERAWAELIPFYRATIG